MTSFPAAMIAARVILQAEIDWYRARYRRHDQTGRDALIIWYWSDDFEVLVDLACSAVPDYNGDPQRIRDRLGVPPVTRDVLHRYVRDNAEQVAADYGVTVVELLAMVAARTGRLFEVGVVRRLGDK